MNRLIPNRIFKPAKELTAEFAYLFAGRTALLREAIDSIQPDDACLAVYGERGVGKTSFARILRGLLDRKIALETLGLEDVTNNLSFRCVWQSVGPRMKCLEDVLYAVLNPENRDPDSFATAFPSIADRLAGHYRKIDKRALAQKSDAEKALVLDLFHHFQGELNHAAFDARVVLFIDEIDRLESQDGLGQLIKTSNFSYVLVGIGDSISDVIADHKSAARKLGRGSFRISTMTNEEIGEFFDKSEQAAASEGFRIRFDTDFRKLAGEDFGGYPNQLQRLGYDALELNAKQIESQARDGFHFDERTYHRILNQRTSLNAHDKSVSDMVTDSVRGSLRKWKLLVFLSGEERLWRSRQNIKRTIDPGLLNDWLKHIDKLQAKKVVQFDRTRDAWRVTDPDIWCEIRRLKRIGWEPKAG